MKNLTLDCFAFNTNYMHEVSEIINNKRAVNEETWIADENTYMRLSPPCAMLHKNTKMEVFHAKHTG